MAGLHELTGLSWLQVAGLIIVGLLTTCVWRRFLSPISDVPGPFWASITRFWHVWYIIRGDQNLELSRQHEKFGHFVRIAPNEVSVSHPDAIRKILAAPLHKGSWYKVIAFPDGRFPNTMSVTDPKVKNELSKHIAPAYTLTNLLQAEDNISQTIELLFGWLDKYSSTGKPIDLDQFFTFATSDVIGEVLFSKQFGFLREGRDVGNAIANAHPQAAYVTVAGFYRWLHVALLSNPVVTWLGITPWGHIVDSAMAAIKERQANPDARFDALAHWLRMLKQHPDKMKMHEIHSAAFNAVAAGNETVATGLQAFVYLMIRHPDAWQRVRAEIEASGSARDRVVSFADAQNLPFLQACIKESLRVFPPAPMGLPRIVPRDGLTIGERTIPKGTIVSTSAWLMHHSKEIWGADVEEFKPDRWLAGDAAQLEKHFIPWGLGYAACPGQNVARIELYKICATLVRDYNIRQVNPKQEWKWEAYFTAVPHDWPCYVERAKPGKA